MRVVVYYNKSVNRNEFHLENHNRIIESIEYLKKYLSKDIPIYDNEEVQEYLKNEFELEKQEISDIILKQVYS